MNIFKSQYSILEEKPYKALIYDEEFEYQEAIKYLSLCLNKKPNNYIALSNMALAYFEMGKIKEASEYIKASAKINAKDDTVNYVYQAIHTNYSSNS